MTRTDVGPENYLKGRVLTSTFAESTLPSQNSQMVRLEVIADLLCVASKAFPFEGPWAEVRQHLGVSTKH